MSYPLALDEYDESRLLEELKRRMLARQRGVCDYCGQFAGSPPCRMKWRHWMARREPEVVTLERAYATAQDVTQAD